MSFALGADDAALLDQVLTDWLQTTSPGDGYDAQNERFANVVNLSLRLGVWLDDQRADAYVPTWQREQAA